MLLAGAFVAPALAPVPVSADELSDAQAEQKRLERKISDQKALIDRLNASQASLASAIKDTKAELNGITDDLAATRRRVDALAQSVAEVTAAYESLVDDLAELDAELAEIEATEAAKKVELRERKEELASRIRRAHEAGRTSMLETLLSGASFTDMLVEMTSELDAAEQDKALAVQIAKDRETLMALHATVEATRAHTDTVRQETGVQKQRLDQRLEELRDAEARLKKLERAAEKALEAQRERFDQMAKDEARLREALAASAAARRKLQSKIDRLVARQYNQGRIPSKYNGTLRWPMPGTVTQPFGCTGFPWEGPRGDCAHFHEGIDIVAPYGTPIRASGNGRVVYCGWNYADGADPAWIVIIAHSSSLTTWYAHMQPKCPARTGASVRQGQVIGYEGNTGRSTGAHLHWMVEFNGTFVNPKLFT